jgi:hypothetical protein
VAELAGATVLAAGDEFLIALDPRRALAEAGCEVLAPLERERPDSLPRPTGARLLITAGAVFRLKPPA